MALSVRSKMEIKEEIKAINEYVLIEPDLAEKTVNGLIIPDGANSKRPNIMGTVKSVGGDSILKVGDRIVFPQYKTDELEFRGKKVLLIKEKYILAKCL